MKARSNLCRQVSEACASFCVGGSDILREMYEPGELQKLLEGLRQQA